MCAARYIAELIEIEEKARRLIVQAALARLVSIFRRGFSSIWLIFLDFPDVSSIFFAFHFLTFRENPRRKIKPYWLVCTGGTAVGYAGRCTLRVCRCEDARGLLAQSHQDPRITFKIRKQAKHS